MQTASVDSYVEILLSLQESCDAFRVGVLNLANERLVQFVDGVMGLMAQLPNEQEMLLQVSQWIQEILAAQQRGDYIAIADTLEYKLKPFLEEIQ